jgi:hypothetical protein
VGEYRTLFRKLNTMAREERGAATARLFALVDKIDRKHPDFDWVALWRQEGVIPSPTDAETWPAELAALVAWLDGLDATKMRPFRLPSGRWVHDPEGYVAAMRRDVARGPDGQHAAQVATDLRDLAIADHFQPKGVAKRDTLRSDGGRAHRAFEITNCDLKGETRPMAAWDDETARRIAWLETVPTPVKPFRLDGHRKVTDSAPFMAGLRREVEVGPDGPRARPGALQDDLAKFEAVLSPMGETDRLSPIVDTGGLLPIGNTQRADGLSTLVDAAPVLPMGDKGETPPVSGVSPIGGGGAA